MVGWIAFSLSSGVIFGKTRFQRSLFFFSVFMRPRGEGCGLGQERIRVELGKEADFPRMRPQLV